MSACPKALHIVVTLATQALHTAPSPGEASSRRRFDRASRDRRVVREPAEKPVGILRLHRRKRAAGLSSLLRLLASGAPVLLVGRHRCDKNNLPMKFSRITVDPRQMDGVPCIRQLRIPVATVVGMMADGMTRDEILKAYPDLKAKDVEEALRYAAEAVRERELPLRSAS